MTSTRLLDLCGAIVGLLVSLPVLVFIAIAIKLDSRGPVFFTQVRVGRQGRPFRLYKFRSMVVDADKHSAITGSVDARVTRVGRMLRPLRLDELPQLLNVLKGEMSLVGPRPEAPSIVSRYTAEQRRIRASVRPGITGLAQVSGRSALPIEQAVALDLWYATHASVRTDLRILARTVAIVLGRGGTN